MSDRTPARGRMTGDQSRHQYTPEQIEFMLAVERHKKRTGRKFLTHTDYLAVAVALGYRRVKDAEAAGERTRVPGAL